ncbi:MAG: hypothetical protein V2I76_01845 [Roseobacter sp.]|jgi:Flp pilus assembly pilin Flp|nr:hypothetical protein [Roseobacter sp.]
MLTFWKRFFKNEDGAITVDWVVMTALVAGLSVSIITEMRDNSNNLSNLTQDYLEDQDPSAAYINIQDVGAD